MQDTPNSNEVYRETLQLISSFLLKGESCFLPGIGVLKQQYQPSMEMGYRILPPNREIVLEKFVYNAQHPIIQEIEYHFQLPAEEAKNTWNKILDTIKSELQNNRPILIPGIGKLEQDEHQEMQFTAFPPEKFYEQIQLPEDTAQEDIANELPFTEERPHKKRTFLYILIIIILLFVSGALAYLYLPSFKNFINTQINSFQQNREDTSSIITKDSTLINTTSALPADTAAQSLIPTDTVPANDSIHFVVIYRTFYSINRSEQYFKKMRGWGHHIVVYTKDSTSFLIGYPYDGLPADTAKRIEEIQNIYHEKTFVIYPQIQHFSIITFD